MARLESPLVYSDPDGKTCFNSAFVGGGHSGRLSVEYAQSYPFYLYNLLRVRN